VTSKGEGIDLKTKSEATADKWGVKITLPTYTDGVCDEGTAKVKVTAPKALSLDNETAMLIVTLSKKGGTTLSTSRTLTSPDKYNSIGNGTAASPYLIYNALQLQSLAPVVNTGKEMKDSCFRMESDIDLSGVCHKVDGTPENDVSWIPIGGLVVGASHSFNGTFDGNGHKIKSLYINQTALDYQGLFGWTYNSSTIKGLTVYGSVYGKEFAGGIVAVNYGTIEDCASYVTVNAVDQRAAGIAAFNAGEIKGCSNYGDISGNVTSQARIGGIAGYSEDGSIIGCSNYGKISGPGSFIGGIVGDADNNGVMANCRNCGEINGTGNAVGGIVGEGTSWSITGCTNSGKVSGNSDVGGISGGDGIVSGCSNSAAISATTNHAGGISGGTNSVTGSFNYGPVKGERTGGVCGSLNYSISGCFNTASVTGTTYVGIIVGINYGTVNDCRYVSGTGITPIGNGSTPATVTAETIANLQGTAGLDLLNNAIKDWNNGTYNGQSVKGSIYACDYHFVADDATPANNGYPVIVTGAPQ
jgi:hypothetical protein